MYVLYQVNEGIAKLVTLMAKGYLNFIIINFENIWLIGNIEWNTYF
jgi:hypothetical protein